MTERTLKLDKPTLYVMCGIPGSGKSTYAKKLLNTRANKDRLKLISTDELRKELLGDEKDLSQQDMIFEIAYKRTEELLKQGYNVIFDAMSITLWARKEIIEYFNEYANLICIVMMTPLDECIKNQYKRERQVPEEVIEKMNKRFTYPVYLEGWDLILNKYY